MTDYHNRIEKCLAESLTEKRPNTSLIYERTRILIRPESSIVYVEEERNEFERTRTLFSFSIDDYSFEEMVSLIEERLHFLQEEKLTMKTLGYEVQGYSKYIRRTKDYSIVVDRYRSTFHACKILKNQPLKDCDQMSSSGGSLLEFMVRFEKEVMTSETMLDVNRELRWRMIGA